MPSDIKEIEAGLDHLLKKEYISESTVEFFRAIIKAQENIKNKLLKKEVPCTLTDQEITENLQKGAPLISWSDIPVDGSILKDLFYDICKIMKTQENADKNAIEKIIKAETSGDLKLDIIMKKLFSLDSQFFTSFSKDHTISQDLLLFCTVHLAKPFFETAALKFRDKVDDMKWLRNYCPVCGASAQISRLEKDEGQRMLYCSLCSTQWRYMRIKCAFCCNEEQKSMKFLEVEGSPYRIDLCDQCGRYLKTRDDRKVVGKLREIIAPIEDLATMYLDMKAEEEGYERSWFFPPNIKELKAYGKETTAVH